MQWNFDAEFPTLRKTALLNADMVTNKEHYITADLHYNFLKHVSRIVRTDQVGLERCFFVVTLAHMVMVSIGAMGVKANLRIDVAPEKRIKSMRRLGDISK